MPTFKSKHVTKSFIFHLSLAVVLYLAFVKVSQIDFHFLCPVPDFRLVQPGLHLDGVEEQASLNLVARVRQSLGQEEGGGVHSTSSLLNALKKAPQIFKYVNGNTCTLIEKSSYGIFFTEILVFIHGRERKCVVCVCERDKEKI